MAKILRKSLEYHKAQFPKSSFLFAENQCCVIFALKVLKRKLKFRIYKTGKENETQFGQFISESQEKFHRPQAYFREKLRKLKSRENEAFLLKKHAFDFAIDFANCYFSLKS